MPRGTPSGPLLPHSCSHPARCTAIYPALMSSLSLLLAAPCHVMCRCARLITKPALVPLYEAAGFSLLGPSDVVHGQDAWMEMECMLQSGESDS